MKRSLILIFGLFATSFAHVASANEISFKCDYELGTGTHAKRQKLGSITVAIDVAGKSARIDFGNGWFKTNTLLVEGTGVKEMAPPTSGKELGFFYFDLKVNTGGFSGSGMPEFFDACVQDNSHHGMPDDVESSAINSDHKEPATDPAAARKQAFSAPTPRQATTEYYGHTELRTKPAWEAEATKNSNYKGEEARLAAAPAAGDKPALPQTSGKAATEYYGGTTLRARPAWAAEATMNLDPDKSAPTADAPASSPAAAPVHEDHIEECTRALGTAAEAANIYFFNGSSVIDPRNKAELRTIAEIVNDCGNVVVEVGGHTDDFGNPANNKRLSQLRANAVVHFLIREGVDPTKLEAVGYGQDWPIASNETLEGRRLNRRVEFRALRR